MKPTRVPGPNHGKTIGKWWFNEILRWFYFCIAVENSMIFHATGSIPSEKTRPLAVDHHTSIMGKSWYFTNLNSKAIKDHKRGWCPYKILLKKNMVLMVRENSEVIVIYTVAKPGPRGVWRVMEGPCRCNLCYPSTAPSWKYHDSIMKVSSKYFESIIKVSWK